MVMREGDEVLVTTGETDPRAVFDAVWDKLLPAFQESAGANDPGTSADLKKRLAALSLRLPDGQTDAPMARKVSGKVYSMMENELGIRQVSLSFEGRRGVF